MQTDIILKQLKSSLAELKTAVEKFEKHESPSTQYTEALYNALSNSNKLVSAYLVLKEKNDVAPDLDIHLKLMNMPSNTVEKQNIADAEPTTVIDETNSTDTQQLNIQKKESIEQKADVIQTSVAETITNNSPETKSVTEGNTSNTLNSTIKELPKMNININDKFRMINDLFKGNGNEYNIAVEQLNTVNTLAETNHYLNGLKDIYQWDEDSEMVKKLISLAQKRFS